MSSILIIVIANIFSLCGLPSYSLFLMALLRYNSHAVQLTNLGQSSMAFSISTELYDHHHSHLEHYSSLPKETPHLLVVITQSAHYLSPRQH